MAIVTASTAGIGLGIVRRLASEVGAGTVCNTHPPPHLALLSWYQTILSCLQADRQPAFVGFTLTSYDRLGAHGAACSLDASAPAVCLLQGARVVVSSRKQQNVEETVQQLRAEGLQVAGIACHVGDGAAIKARPAWAAQHQPQVAACCCQRAELCTCCGAPCRASTLHFGVRAQCATWPAHRRLKLLLLPPHAACSASSSSQSTRMAGSTSWCPMRR